MNNDPYQTDMDEAWEQAKREQADEEYISKKDAMEFFKYDVYVVNELNNMPSVVIPLEYDGCNGCKAINQITQIKDVFRRLECEGYPASRLDEIWQIVEPYGEI